MPDDFDGLSSLGYFGQFSRDSVDETMGDYALLLLLLLLLF